VYFIYSLFNDAVNNSDNTTLIDKMIVNNDLKRIWMVAIVTCFKVLPRNFGGEADENHEKPQT
jgi:hypothetical protein